MPVNGLMVTLSSDPRRASGAAASIDAHESIECGERHDRWLAVAIESGNEREARELHAWLESLPGVDQVSVILVTLDEPSP
jgi:hypothetical protein